MVQIRRQQSADDAIAMQIRAGRAILGWTQDEVAAKTGISRRAIIDMETGTRLPHKATIERITAVFAEAGVAWIECGDHVGVVRRIAGHVQGRGLQSTFSLPK